MRPPRPVIAVARRGDGHEVRAELLDAATGDTVCGVDPAGVRPHRVDGDMSRRLFALSGGVLVSGLESGRVVAFAAATVDGAS